MLAKWYHEFMSRHPKEFIHVDWSGSLVPNGLITRGGVTVGNVAIENFLADLELRDLSTFGTKHLCGDRSEWATACRELLCEWMRRERHKNEISRFHCVFGFDTMPEAQAFCAVEQITNASFWKVLAADYSGKKDMCWFAKGKTLMEQMYFCDRYWSGDPANDQPRWEVLLHPSVLVREKIS